MYYRDQDDSDSPVSYLLDAWFFQDSETTGNDLRVKFRLRNSSNDARDMTMRVLITNWSMNCAVGEVVTVDVSFESIGEPMQENPM